MTTVYTGASMSLDGFVAGPDDSDFDHLFAWYNNGPNRIETANPGIQLSMNEASTAHYKEILGETGAIVVGRHLFAMTEAWTGQHPMGVPVVVLTHEVPDGWPREDANFHVVTDGIDQAVATASELAAGKVVGVNAGTIASKWSMGTVAGRKRHASPTYLDRCTRDGSRRTCNSRVVM